MKNVFTLGLPKILGLAIAAASACACGAPEEETDAVQREVVDRFQIEGSTISFVKYTNPEGESAMVITEEGPADAPPSLVAQLLEQYKGLTHLEVLEALAPSDYEPSEQIVRAHSEEVVSLERAGEEVRAVDFVPERLVDKSPGSCYDFIFAGGGTWSTTQVLNRVNFPYTVASALTTNPIRAGICQEGAAGIRVNGGWYYGNSGGNISETIPGYTSKSYYFLDSTVSKKLWLKAWNWTGSGVFYHLMAGEQTGS